MLLCKVSLLTPSLFAHIYCNAAACDQHEAAGRHPGCHILWFALFVVRVVRLMCFGPSLGMGDLEKGWRLGASCTGVDEVGCCGVIMG